jgi:hypothetical protein
VAHDRDDGFRVPPLVTSFTARGPLQVAVDGGSRDRV